MVAAESLEGRRQLFQAFKILEIFKEVNQTTPDFDMSSVV